MELLTEKYVREKQERDAENPPEHWGRHPDVYVHKPCGGATQMPEHIRRNYLADPNFYGSDTICSHCGGPVPESQCFWVDTGECLTDCTKRLKKEKSQSTDY